MSIVRIGLARRATGLSREACQQHWRSEHARLFAQLPGLLSYVQNHAVLGTEGEPVLGEPGFDIFSEVEFADEATIQEVSGSRYYRDVILTDERKLLDASGRTFLMTQRQILKGEPPREGFFKLALFLSRASPNPAARAGDWLLEVAKGAATPVAVVAHIVERVGGAHLLPVDLVLQQYFGGLDEARQAYQGASDRWAIPSRGETTIVAAVVVRECQVVPRVSAGQCVEVPS